MIYVYSIYVVCLSLIFSCKTENGDDLNKEKNDYAASSKNEELSFNKLADTYSKMVSGSLNKGFADNRKGIDKLIASLETKNQGLQNNMQNGIEDIKHDINSLKSIFEYEKHHVEKQAGLKSETGLASCADSSCLADVEPKPEVKSNSDIEIVDCNEPQICYNTFLEKEENVVWYNNLARLASQFNSINYFKIFLDKKNLNELELKAKKIRKNVFDIKEGIGNDDAILKVVNNIVVYIKLLQNSELVYRSPLHLLKLTKWLLKRIQQLKGKEGMDITNLSNLCNEFYYRVLSSIISKAPNMLFLSSKISQQKAFAIDKNALKTFCDFYCTPEVRSETMKNIESVFGEKIQFGFHRKTKDEQTPQFCHVMQLIKQSPELCNLYNKDVANIAYDVALHPFHILYLSYCVIVGIYRDIQISTEKCNQKVECLIRNLKLQYEILNLINESYDDISLAFTAGLDPCLPIFSKEKSMKNRLFSRLMELLEIISQIKYHLESKYQADCKKDYLYDNCYEETLTSCFCDIEDSAYRVISNVKKVNKKLTGMQKAAIKNERFKLKQLNAYISSVKLIKANIEKCHANNQIAEKSASMSEEEACRYLDQIPLSYIKNFLEQKKTFK